MGSQDTDLEFWILAVEPVNWAPASAPVVARPHCRLQRLCASWWMGLHGARPFVAIREAWQVAVETEAGLCACDRLVSPVRRREPVTPTPVVWNVNPNFPHNCLPALALYGQTSSSSLQGVGWGTQRLFGRTSGSNQFGPLAPDSKVENWVGAGKSTGLVRGVFLGWGGGRRRGDETGPFCIHGQWAFCVWMLQERSNSLLYASFSSSPSCRPASFEHRNILAQTGSFRSPCALPPPHQGFLFYGKAEGNKSNSPCCTFGDFLHKRADEAVCLLFFFNSTIHRIKCPDAFNRRLVTSARRSL